MFKYNIFIIWTDVGQWFIIPVNKLFTNIVDQGVRQRDDSYQYRHISFFGFFFPPTLSSSCLLRSSADLLSPYLCRRDLLKFWISLYFLLYQLKPIFAKYRPCSAHWHLQVCNVFMDLVPLPILLSLSLCSVHVYTAVSFSIFSAVSTYW